MPTPAFDLREQAGFTPEHAEAAAEAMSASDVATKADLLEAKAELKGDLADVKTQIAETKADLLKVIIAALAVNVVTILGAMFGLAKLLGH